MQIVFGGALVRNRQFALVELEDYRSHTTESAAESHPARQRLAANRTPGKTLPHGTLRPA